VPTTILAIAGLVIGAVQPLAAQPNPVTPPLSVPSGGTLRATLGAARAEVGVVSRAMAIALTFGRTEAGRFVPYRPGEPIAFDRPFLVQARFGSEPPYEQTTITLTTKDGGTYAVPLFKTAGRPDVFESAPMVFEDPSGCRGLKFCRP
jgi:hypothetical protein